MDFDFLIATSWSHADVERTSRWANELAHRGYDVCFLHPSNRVSYRTSDDVQTVSLADLERETTRTPTPDEVESTFDISSLAHLAFTERLFFGLSHEDALNRGCRLAAAFEKFFERHSVDYALQIRGPELHRLLVHRFVEYHGGTPIWAGFSPFDGSFSLHTDLQGSWDTYETIPYTEISETDRAAVREHMAEFVEAQERYAYNAGADADQPLSSRFLDTAETFWNFARRDAPGRHRDQIRSELRYWVQEHVNRRLFPGVEESRRQLDATDYVFFPLQYPIESRLTVFSPQFYHQEHAVEYVARSLPASKQLFVKPHPHHPEFPNPDVLMRFKRHPRIEVLHPELNAHEVIEKSDGVVVTNNTVGFETLYYQKPLVVLGNALYDETSAVTTVRDMGTLPDVLGDIVGTTVSEERTVESIYSLQQAAYPGDRASADPSDVETVVDSVVQFTEDIA